MQIVDAQVRIWAANSAARPWPASGRSEPQRSVFRRRSLAEMNAAGVDRAVLVAPSWEGDRTDLTRLPCSYRQGVTFFTEELPFLSEAEKAWVMGRAVCEWLGWKLPA
jgi:hypothetical protein